MSLNVRRLLSQQALLFMRWENDDGFDADSGHNHSNHSNSNDIVNPNAISEIHQDPVDHSVPIELPIDVVVEQHTEPHQDVVQNQDHAAETANQHFDSPAFHQLVNESPDPVSTTTHADNNSAQTTSDDRRASYEARGLNYDSVAQGLARIGINIDDVRFSESAPGKSAMEWSEENMPTGHAEGISSFNSDGIDSSMDSLQASFQDGRGSSESYAVNFSQSLPGGSENYSGSLGHVDHVDIVQTSFDTPDSHSIGTVEIHDDHVALQQVPSSNISFLTDDERAELGISAAESHPVDAHAVDTGAAPATHAADTSTMLSGHTVAQDTTPREGVDTSGTDYTGDAFRFDDPENGPQKSMGGMWADSGSGGGGPGHVADSHFDNVNADFGTDNSGNTYHADGSFTHTVTADDGHSATFNHEADGSVASVTFADPSVSAHSGTIAVELTHDPTADSNQALNGHVGQDVSVTATANHDSATGNSTLNIFDNLPEGYALAHFRPVDPNLPLGDQRLDLPDGGHMIWSDVPGGKEEAVYDAHGDLVRSTNYQGQEPPRQDYSSGGSLWGDGGAFANASGAFGAINAANHAALTTDLSGSAGAHVDTGSQGGNGGVVVTHDSHFDDVNADFGTDNSGNVYHADGSFTHTVAADDGHSATFTHEADGSVASVTFADATGPAHTASQVDLTHDPTADSNQVLNGHVGQDASATGTVTHDSAPGNSTLNIFDNLPEGYALAHFKPVDPNLPVGDQRFDIPGGGHLIWSEVVGGKQEAIYDAHGDLVRSTIYQAQEPLPQDSSSGGRSWSDGVFFNASGPFGSINAANHAALTTDPTGSVAVAHADSGSQGGNAGDVVTHDSHFDNVNGAVATDNSTHEYFADGSHSQTVTTDDGRSATFLYDADGNVSSVVHSDAVATVQTGTQTAVAHDSTADSSPDHGNGHVSDVVVGGHVAANDVDPYHADTHPQGHVDATVAATTGQTQLGLDASGTHLTGVPTTHMDNLGSITVSADEHAQRAAQILSVLYPDGAGLNQGNLDAATHYVMNGREDLLVSRLQDGQPLTPLTEPQHVTAGNVPSGFRLAEEGESGVVGFTSGGVAVHLVEVQVITVTGSRSTGHTESGGADGLFNEGADHGSGGLPVNSEGRIDFSPSNTTATSLSDTVNANLAKLPDGASALYNSATGALSDFLTSRTIDGQVLSPREAMGAVVDALATRGINFIQSVDANTSSAGEFALVLAGGATHAAYESTVGALNHAAQVMSDPHATPEQVAVAMIEFTGAASVIVGGSAAIRAVTADVAVTVDGLAAAGATAGRVAIDAAGGITPDGVGIRSIDNALGLGHVHVGVGTRIEPVLGDVTPVNGHNGMTAVDVPNSGAATHIDPVLGDIAHDGQGGGVVHVDPNVPVHSISGEPNSNGVAAIARVDEAFPGNTYTTSSRGDMANGTQYREADLSAVDGSKIAHVDYTIEPSGSLYIERLDVEAGAQGQGVSKAVFAQILNEHPEINAIKAGTLQDDNLAVYSAAFKAALNDGAKVEDAMRSAIMETPAYRVRASLGFTDLEFDPFNSGQPEFTMRRPEVAANNSPNPAISHQGAGVDIVSGHSNVDAISVGRAVTDDARFVGGGSPNGSLDSNGASVEGMNRNASMTAYQIDAHGNVSIRNDVNWADDQVAQGSTLVVEDTNGQRYVWNGGGSQNFNQSRLNLVETFLANSDSPFNSIEVASANRLANGSSGGVLTVDPSIANVNLHQVVNDLAPTIPTGSVQELFPEDFDALFKRVPGGNEP